MQIKPIFILFNADGSGGSASGAGGGQNTGGDQTVTLAKSEHIKLTERVTFLESESKKAFKERDDTKTELKTKIDEEATKTQKITELEQALSKLETEKAEYKAGFEGLEGSVRKSYLEQLSDEHKGVAKLIPTIEGLAEYVKLNRAGTPAGTDSGKPGSGHRDFTSSKWDDLNHEEKEEVRTKRPDIWRKLYKDKFGTEP
jgi:hypothetical protein